MGALTGKTDSPRGQVRLRYWAAARAAAGGEPAVVEITGAVALEALTERAKALHASTARFAAVLDTCSVLVGDTPVGSRAPGTVRVEPGQTVEFLPPFAGG